MARKIAFIRYGSFSHTNASVSGILRDHFAEYRLEDIEICELLGRSQAAKIFNALSILKYYGGDILKRRRSFQECKFRTPHMFAHVKERMQKRLGRDLSHYIFSFQTQSLYDASVPGVPHFVYTDHTHLTNLYYPTFDPSKLFMRAWIDLEASLYHKAARVFTMSHHVRRSLLEHYHCAPDRVSCVFAGSHVLPPPLQNDNYCNKRILFAGIDWDRKGGPYLVEAFKKVQQRHPKAQLTIVGCSPELNLENCDVVGRVPLEQMRNFYAQASVFCVPTLLEPFGIVFVEALLSKIPVIATDLGALPEIVDNGKSGFLVEPKNSAALARALDALLSDPTSCRRFGEYGHQRVVERYSWNATGRRMQQEIQAVIQEDKMVGWPSMRGEGDVPPLA